MFRLVQCNKCMTKSNLEDYNAGSLTCYVCGSSDITVNINVSDSLSLNTREQIKGKVKESGYKKPIKEFIHGDDFHRTANKWSDKTRIIDRKNDQYYEKVVDKETGEVIHECKEPLSKHWGHGSAKKKD